MLEFGDSESKLIFWRMLNDEQKAYFAENEEEYETLYQNRFCLNASHHACPTCGGRVEQLPQNDYFECVDEDCHLGFRGNHTEDTDQSCESFWEWHKY